MTTERDLRPPTVSDGPESRTTAWGFTSLLLLLYVINWGDKTILGLAAQPLREELGLTTTQIGLLGSAFFLAFAVGGFFAGGLAKLTTLRWALVLLSLIWAASMLPVVLSATFTVLLVARIVLGFGEGPSSALIHTAAYTWHPPARRGLPSALISASASVAKIVVAPALAVIMAVWGWRAGFLVLAGVGVLWCGIWLLTWKEGPYGSAKATTGTTPENAAGDDTERTVPWRSIFLTPTFMGGAAGIFAMYGIVTVVLTFLPSYLEVGLGYSRVEAGVMFGFPSIAGMGLMVLSSAISDRLIARGASSRTLRGVLPALGLLVCGTLLAIVPLLGTPWLVVLAISVGYGAGAIALPLSNAAVSEICPPKQMAGTLGVFLAVMSLGGLAAPYLTGVIVDAAATPADGYALAFQLFGLVAVAGGLLALVSMNPPRDAARVAAVPSKT
ncbi:MFS transporter [Pseudonocardia sp. C8]|uniref:MFS transporter n=1 Tax=Pseudonocardia sp. C8 TaxID=2762759 RepID=UPI0016423606|nr:MFS transporter [Pseudonocardia sp. C8]MBC3192999.1 MFS transporter [Pseudonocardia sp. C8]